MRVVITGAGSGFGHALSRRLLARGDEVIAVDREPQGLPPLVALGAVAEIVDVRDGDAVDALAARVLGAGPVHAVVNDAGYAVFGSQAEADLSEVAAMFETNVLGPARVTRAFLPSLRAHGGVVVQLSSIAGRLVLAESGFYAASKHALEAMSEALYLENLRFGLRVVVIEPGAFATGFSARAGRHSRPRDPSSPHAPDHAGWDRARGELVLLDQDPALVVDGIVAAIDGGEGFVRVRVGLDAARWLAERERVGDAAWMAAMAGRFGGG
jgi:NAD(P)-dependent dehydrogenase (short-subunit alcohol dehydrogenase family)